MAFFNGPDQADLTDPDLLRVIDLSIGLAGEEEREQEEMAMALSASIEQHREKVREQEELAIALNESIATLRLQTSVLEAKKHNARLKQRERRTMKRALEQSRREFEAQAGDVVDQQTQRTGLHEDLDSYQRELEEAIRLSLSQIPQDREVHRPDGTIKSRLPEENHYRSSGHRNTCFFDSLITSLQHYRLGYNPDNLLKFFTSRGYIPDTMIVVGQTAENGRDFYPDRVSHNHIISAWCDYAGYDIQIWMLSRPFSPTNTGISEISYFASFSSNRRGPRNPRVLHILNINNVHFIPIVPNIY